MKDKNGVELNIGDWARMTCGNTTIIGKIFKIDAIYVYQQVRVGILIGLKNFRMKKP